MDYENIAWKIIDIYFKDNPNLIVKHHLKSYNDFFDNGIQQIFKENNPITFLRMLTKKQTHLNIISICILVVEKETNCILGNQ